LNDWANVFAPRRLAYLLTFALLSTSAQAQTGQDLFDQCASKETMRQLSCMVYISGFVHAMQASQNLRSEICLPDTLTGAEASNVFVTTLTELKRTRKGGDNPFLSGPQNASLAAALGMRFPCSRP
jgi:hypothetical protein